MSSTSITLPDDIQPRPHGERPRCAATNRSGSRCQKTPVPGATVCRYHGGAAPQVALAAARRVARNEAVADLAGRDIPPISDPGHSLLRAAGEMEALKDALGERAAALQEAQITVTDKQGQQALAAVITAYEQSLRGLSDTLVRILKLGLQDRQVRVQEAQSRLLVEAVTKALASPEADLTFDQIQTIRRLVAENLSNARTDVE